MSAQHTPAPTNAELVEALKAMCREYERAWRSGAHAWAPDWLPHRNAKALIEAAETNGGAVATDLIDAARRLERRGFFAPSTCADDATAADMALMRAAIAKLTGSAA